MSRSTTLRIAAAAGSVALALCATAARAQAPAEPPARDRGSDRGVPADEARGWADPPGDDPEDVALFVPRLVLTPPRLVLGVLFWPVQKGLRFVERHALIERTEDAFYNDERDSAILPVLAFQSGLGPSVGVQLFDENLAGHGERIQLDARFGGLYEQAYQIGFDGDRVLGSRYWIQTLSRFEIQPRLLFHGIGDLPERTAGSALDPHDAAVETRFRQRRFLQLGRFGYTIGHPGNLTKVGATAIFNDRTFGPDTVDRSESIERTYDTSRLPGFTRGARLLELDGNVVVDTRDVPGATSSGVYLELFGGGVPNIGASDWHFWHYAAEATLYLDLYRKTRVLVLRGAVEAVHGRYENIPFTDLPRLGGPNRLRGYQLDRFRDKRAAVATAEYHYPIHELLAGSFFVDAGRVAPDYEGLTRARDWRVGGGGGLILRSKSSVLFTLDVAYGEGAQLYFTTDPLRAFAGRNEQL